MLWPVPTGSAQEPGTVDVRLFGAEGQDEATAVWADGHGILLAGETTSDILMAEGQAVWAPGGPTGLKGFVTAFDTASTGRGPSPLSVRRTPLGHPRLAVRDVVRSPSILRRSQDAPVEGQVAIHLDGRPSRGRFSPTTAGQPGRHHVHRPRGHRKRIHLGRQRGSTAVPGAMAASA